MKKIKQSKKSVVLFFFGIMTVLLCACGKKTEIYLDAIEDSEQSEQVLNTEVTADCDKADADVDGNGTLFVYVCGAVQSPGVYEVEAGSRIYSAVQMAGGLSYDAKEGVINMAEPLADGMMIQIPRQGEDMSGVGDEAEVEDDRVNLNTASAADLMTLPGIGQSKADTIIQFREDNGPFTAIEDIMKIAGIKDGVFQKIKNQIKV